MSSPWTVGSPSIVPLSHDGSFPSSPQTPSPTSRIFGRRKCGPLVLEVDIPLKKSVEVKELTRPATETNRDVHRPSSVTSTPQIGSVGTVPHMAVPMPAEVREISGPVPEASTGSQSSSSVSSTPKNVGSLGSTSSSTKPLVPVTASDSPVASGSHVPVPLLSPPFHPLQPTSPSRRSHPPLPEQSAPRIPTLPSNSRPMIGGALSPIAAGFSPENAEDLAKFCFEPPSSSSMLNPAPISPPSGGNSDNEHGDVFPLSAPMKRSPKRRVTFSEVDTASQLAAYRANLLKNMHLSDAPNSPSASQPLPHSQRRGPRRSFAGGAGIHGGNMKLNLSPTSSPPASPAKPAAARQRRVTFSEEDTEDQLAAFRSSAGTTFAPPQPIADAASPVLRSAMPPRHRRATYSEQGAQAELNNFRIEMGRLDSSTPPPAPPPRRQRVAGGGHLDMDAVPPPPSSGSGRRLTSSEAETSKALSAFRRGLHTVENAFETLAEPLLPLSGRFRRQTASEADTAQQLAAFRNKLSRGELHQSPKGSVEGGGSGGSRRMSYSETDSAAHLTEFRTSWPHGGPGAEKELGETRRGSRPEVPVARSRRMTSSEAEISGHLDAFRVGLAGSTASFGRSEAAMLSRTSSTSSVSSVGTPTVNRRMTTSEAETARELAAFRARIFDGDTTPPMQKVPPAATKGKYRRLSTADDMSVSEKNSDKQPLLEVASEDGGCAEPPRDKFEVDVAIENGSAIEKYHYHDGSRGRPVMWVLVVAMIVCVSVFGAVFGRQGLPVPLPHRSTGDEDILGKCNTCWSTQDCPVNAACMYSFADGALLQKCGQPVLCVGGFVFNTSTCECDPIASWLYRQPCPGGFSWDAKLGWCVRETSGPCVSRYLCAEEYSWNHILCECLPATPAARCVNRYLCAEGYRWNRQVCSCVP